MSELNPEILKHLYSWLDSIPFSRPRKRLARDFADGSMVTELINYFIPNSVQENAFPPCMSTDRRLDNWERLNKKVLVRLGIRLSKDQMKDLAGAKLRTTEAFLCQLAALIYRKKYDAIQNALQVQSTVDTEDSYMCYGFEEE